MARLLAVAFTLAAACAGTGVAQAQWGSANILRAALTYDESPVTVWRVVIVESSIPLVKHGEQMSENDFTKNLARWQSTSGAQIALDSGFIAPDATELKEPLLQEGGGNMVTINGVTIRQPGPIIRLRSEHRPAGLHVRAVFSLLSLEGQTLTRSFDRTQPLPSSTESRLSCKSVGRVEWEGDSPLLTVTALTDTTEGASSLHYAIFLVPVTDRPALRPASGKPKEYAKSSVQVVLGTVPSETFWPMLKAVRPDLKQPPLIGGGVLPLFWTDEKWRIFTQAMTAAGARWEKPIEGTFTPKDPPIHLHNTQMDATLTWPLAPDSTRLEWKIDLPKVTATYKGTSSTGSQNGLLYRPLCESLNNRWNFIVRYVGLQTHILAVRFHFE